MIFSKYCIISFCCLTNTAQFLISVIAFTKSLNNVENLVSVILVWSASINDYIFSLLMPLLPFLFFLLWNFFSSFAIILNRFFIYFFFMFLFSFSKNLYLASAFFLLAFFSLCRSSSTSINPWREKYFELS